MQTAALQVMALVTHGNAFLADVPIGEFYPAHGIFQFDEYTRFSDLEPGRDGGAWTETPYAEDPNAWFERLLAEKCLGLRAQWIPSEKGAAEDRKTVVFVGGGGRWVVEAVFEDGSDIWEARWTLGDQAHPQRKIWRVTYGRIAKKWKTAPESQRTLEQVAEWVKLVLQNALEYAKGIGQQNFAVSFDEALTLLKADRLLPPYGLALEGQLPLEASRLLAAANAGWVFGGMGSWNDIGDESPEYEKVSGNLFEVLTIALVESVNRSFRPNAS